MSAQSSTGMEQWAPNGAAAADTSERPSWMPNRASTAQDAPEVFTAPSEPEVATPLYCDQCWAPLSPIVEECPDCGRILAEMRAEQARQASEDRRWRPPRAGKPAYRTPEMRKKKPSRIALDESAEVAVPTGMKRGTGLDAARAWERAKPMLTVVGVGFLLGGVAVVSFWLSIITYR